MSEIFKSLIIGFYLDFLHFLVFIFLIQNCCLARRCRPSGGQSFPARPPPAPSLAAERLPPLSSPPAPLFFCTLCCTLVAGQAWSAASSCSGTMNSTIFLVGSGLSSQSSSEMSLRAPRLSSSASLPSGSWSSDTPDIAVPESPHSSTSFFSSSHVAPSTCRAPRGRGW